MDGNDVKRLGLILAVQAEIEGMKAANTEREREGSAVAYPERLFTEAAEELRNLAYVHPDQL